MTQKQNAKVSKAAFIRARPTASIDEVIEAGKAENLEISRQAVHTVRHQQRFEAKLNGKSKKKGAKKRKSAVSANGKSLLKAPDVKKGKHFKAPESVLAKFPGMNKTHDVLEPIDERELAERFATSIRLMIRQSVRAELRSVMGRLSQ